MSAEPIHTDSFPDSQPLLVQIVCNVCTSKYAVGVDKIAGRSVKMRCKKCSAVIVLRGDAPQPTAAVLGSPLEPSNGNDSSDASDASGEHPKLESAIAEGAPANVTGSRSENSVLFTLDTLRGISKKHDIVSVARDSTEALVLASGQNSGLIDMRALASSAASERPLVRAAVVSGQREPWSGYRMFGVAFGASVLLAGGIAAALFASMGDSSAPASATLLPAAAVTATPSSPANAESEAPAVAESNASAAASAPSHRGATRAARHATSRPAARSNPASARSASDRTIEELLAQSAPAPSRHAAPAPRRAAPSPSRSSLPETPSADAVRSAMNGVRGATRSCGGAQHGTASALVGVSGSNGHVSSVAVTGASSTVRACIERAVRRAHFPRFQRSNFSFRYPVQF